MTRKLNAQVLTYFSKHEAVLLSLLRQRLLDLSTNRGQSTDGQNRHWQNLRHFLERDAATFSAKFLTALETSLNDEIQIIARESAQQVLPSKAPGKDEELSLSLMNVAEMDLMLLQDEAAQRFNLRYEEALAQLSLRMRALFKHDVASHKDNPYRPEILVRAFLLALKNCAFSEEATLSALLAFTPDSCIDLGPMYSELDQILTRSGILTQTPRVRKTGIDSRHGGGIATGHASIHSSFAPSRLSGFSESMHSGIEPGYMESYPGSYRHGPAAGMQPGYSESMHGEMGPRYQDAIPGGYRPTVAGGMRSGFAPSVPISGYGGGNIQAGWYPASHARAFLQKLSVDHAPSALDDASAEVEIEPGAPASVAPAGWIASAPGSAPSVAPIAPYLVRYLEELHANVINSLSSNGLDIDLDLESPNLLRTIRRDKEIRGAQEFDRGTVDALAEVFDFVFSDPSIASPLKVVIGRLQIPVLKAALMDRNFFFSPNHPARKLIDALAAAAVAWSPEKGFEDPLYCQIEATVKRVLTEFDQDLALFSEALLEFEEFVTQVDQRVKQQVESLASVQEQEEAQESLEAARAHVDGLLRERIAALPEEHEKTLFLLPFLANQWREVLARAYAHHGSQPAAWKQLLTTTDQLLWSTQHKNNANERRELVAVLPGLVRQLNTSLDALGWMGAERETFTRRLIATHMNAIRSTVEPTQVASPDSQDLRAGDEAVLLLDQRIAAAHELEHDSVDSRLPKFERGMWFDFVTDDADSHRCRLTWISPKRTRFLFTNQEGYDAFVRSEHEVSELLRDGRLKILPRDPLVARAIDHIMAAGDASAPA